MTKDDLIILYYVYHNISNDIIVDLVLIYV